MKIIEYKDIPLDKLVIGKAQARTSGVDKGIDDLANSIAKMGLLLPLVVSPKDADGIYEIITGQKRFLAVSQLGLDTIKCGVLDESPSVERAKAISLTENMVRQDMPSKDYINACTTLYRHYGTIKAVSEELGLPYHKVQQYVKFEQLSPELKEMVDNSECDMKTALRATKAATRDGTVNKERAVVLANEMKSLSGTQQKNLEKAALAAPTAPIEQVVEGARKQPKSRSIRIELEESIHDSLSKYAHEEGTNSEDAAVSLINEGLTEAGYSDE